MEQQGYLDSQIKKGNIKKTDDKDCCLAVVVVIIPVWFFFLINNGCMKKIQSLNNCFTVSKSIYFISLFFVPLLLLFTCSKNIVNRQQNEK